MGGGEDGGKLGRLAGGQTCLTSRCLNPRTFYFRHPKSRTRDRPYRERSAMASPKSGQP